MMGDAKDDLIDAINTALSFDKLKLGDNADAVVERIARAASAHLAGGWRPIETAPRDKPVRLWAQSYGEISRLNENWREFIGEYSGEGGAHGFEWIMSDGDYYAVWLRPSHWMPLAEPPPA